ncbi:hypothetical protein R1sor_023789 [Riccia sorocarpa]|uniref:Uncharacterized protein n=1 Tax=Riccia sorocarpa TaxID=122646 RepID=A0ABD3GNS1_9MARC
MFATELRFGIACPPKLECGESARAREASLQSFSRNWLQFRRSWGPVRRISSHTVAASGVAGADQSRVKGEKAETVEAKAEENPAAKHLNNELSNLLYAGSDPVRQIVILTDTVDTRPFQLSWPSPSVIFAVAPGHAQDASLKEMAASVLKIPKSQLVQYIPEDFAADDNEDEGWGEKLLRVGYRGDKPSVWLLEMRNSFSNTHLQKVLPVASSLMMKDSAFIGAIPASSSSEVETREQLRKLFAAHGFLVEFRKFRIPQSSAGKDGKVILDGSVLLTFSTRQLRLSDPQVEYATMQIMAAEEEGDEEGFTDAW